MKLSDVPLPEGRIRDLMRRYQRPDQADLTPAEHAFGQLCSWRSDLELLPELVRHAGRPLVRIRCAEDRALIAAVWRTPAGPLLVAAHQVDTWSPAERADLRRDEAQRAWTPRVALAGDDLGRLLPPPCPQCRLLRPMTAEGLASAVAEALTCAPVTLHA